jgi:putative cell wall-binding protein
MPRSFRSFGVLVLAFLLLVAVMPASAFGAVTLTWERNFGTADTVAPFDDGSFWFPTDVAVDKWGNVYVADGWMGPDRIQMFTADGDFVKKYDNPGSDPGELSQPRVITTDRWGHIYVTQQDAGSNPRIEVFNPTLYSHLRSISTPATPPDNSVGIAVGLDGTIYNSRQWTDLQVRDWLGTYITAITPPHVMGIAVTQDDELYVAVDGSGGDPQNMIGVYNPDLSLKWVWGGTGTDPGQYNRPWDIGVDPLSNVYVVEWVNDRAQVLSQNSDPLAVFGATGPAERVFISPSGIGVGPDRTVYVADSGNNRISKWNVSVPTASVQVAGGSRITTAIEASKKAFPDGADIAVIATGFNWPDALGGAALAGAVNGPLLLTNPAALPAEVAAELDRLDVMRVYILGGTAAVSDAVLNAARAHTNLAIATRLAGVDRYQTAIAVAEETKAMRGSDYDGTAFVCTGVNFPDALAASPIAAANGWPIYLTPPGALPADVQASMMRTFGGNPSNHGFIIGGETVVSPAVQTTLATAPFMGYGRIAGLNRYDTAAKVADFSYGLGMLWSRPALATGENYPDALAGGVLQGSDCCPVLLTRTGTLSPEASAMLTKWKDYIYEVRFVGGDGAIKPTVRTAAKALLW